MTHIHIRVCIFTTLNFDLQLILEIFPSIDTRTNLAEKFGKYCENEKL